MPRSSEVLSMIITSWYPRFGRIYTIIIIIITTYASTVRTFYILKNKKYVLMSLARLSAALPSRDLGSGPYAASGPGGHHRACYTR